MSDFRRQYKSPVSIGKWLNNRESELSRVFRFKIRMGRANKRHYTITRLDGKIDRSFSEQKGWHKYTSVSKENDEADDLPTDNGDEVIQKLQAKLDSHKKKRKTNINPPNRNKQ